jgi:hypothetical protein
MFESFRSSLGFYYGRWVGRGEGVEGRMRMLGLRGFVVPADRGETVV